MAERPVQASPLSFLRFQLWTLRFSCPQCRTVPDNIQKHIQGYQYSLDRDPSAHGIILLQWFEGGGSSLVPAFVGMVVITTETAKQAPVRDWPIDPATGWRCHLTESCRWWVGELSVRSFRHFVDREWRVRRPLHNPFFKIYHFSTVEDPISESWLGRQVVFVQTVGVECRIGYSLGGQIFKHGLPVSNPVAAVATANHMIIVLWMEDPTSADEPQLEAARVLVRRLSLATPHLPGHNDVETEFLSGHNDSTEMEQLTGFTFLVKDKL